MAQLASDVLVKMRLRLPGAVEMVYDRYNALVIGFGPNERASDAGFSIVVYPRWINLFLLYGAYVPDPEGILKGSGKQVRHIRINSADDLDSPGVRSLMAKAIEMADPKIDDAQPGRMVIRAVSGKQRKRW